MSKLCVTGGIALEGTVEIAGSKNSSLPLLAACLLIPEAVTLVNVPHVYDVQTTLQLLVNMGVSLRQDADDTHTITIDTKNIAEPFVPYDLVKTMRASILALGPLLARFGRARVSLPGGCAIGLRPVDLHIQGLQALGADIAIDQGYIDAVALRGLQGTEFVFEKVTVNGTQNIMMAAVCARGTTTLHHCACEPEVVELAQFLNCCGARITGMGTGTIVIEGVDALHGCAYSVQPDRIETGTYLIAAAITKGSVRLEKTNPSLLQSSLDKLREGGLPITVGEDWIMLERPSAVAKAVDISTAIYPGIPTDMQAQWMVYNAVASGSSVVIENIFENRFMHVQELQRLGADLHLVGNTVYCQGSSFLEGAPVMATDLRASASLVLAGLVAQGMTVIDRIYHIDRGYESLEKKLRQLGARIERITAVE
jgi:UDP-N-acetylglucosamine 1-carboxyvinyltransferase